MKIKVSRDSALVIVDPQNDFMPGGALPVPEGDKIIPQVNNYIKLFIKAEAIIVATRDWHPEDHISFKEHGGIWPKHCVQNTRGAEFHPYLQLPDHVIIVSKGFERDKEAYSGFEGTGLSKLLNEKSVKEIFVCGVATDYCVKSTVLDGVKNGFKTYVLVDAVKGVDVNPGDSERALKEMTSAGAMVARLEDIEA